VKEVIAEILEEEKKARERVAEAQEKARQILKSAEAESRRITVENTARIQKETAAILAKVEKDTLEQKEQDLNGIEGAGDRLWESKKKGILSAIDGLFNMVLSGKAK
jgi:vacuolar-type H+-ATPase subunit H